MEHEAPGRERFVGGEDHRALPAMAFVDDVEEHIRRVGAVGEIADFIDDQEVGMRVGGEGLREAAGAKAVGEVVDQFRRGDEARRKGVLDGPVGDRHREMRLSAPWLPEQDQRAPLGDEVGREGGAEERESHGGLVREIEVVDRLEEGKRGAPREPGEARLLALRDFFRHEDGEQLLVGPLLLLGAHEEIPPDPTRVGQVQAFEEGIQVNVRSRRGPGARARRGSHP